MKTSLALSLVLSLLLVSCNTTPPKEPTIGSSTIEEALHQQFQTSEGMQVEITEQVEGFATGNYDFGENRPGGGVFIAAKRDDLWIIAFTGNGLPDCTELDAYAIPAQILGVCTGEDGELVER